MYKITEKYEDYNGVERTEDLYFHLSKAELMEMEMGTTGGLGEMIKNIIAAQDTPAIIKLFKNLVLKAYGIKSPDGKQFIKNDEIRTAFEQTEAYSQIFVRLATNAEEATKFVNGIVPKDIAAEAMKQSGAGTVIPMN